MRHQIKEEHAAKIRGWFEEGRGIAVWRSINLSNPGGSWTTPAYDPGGQTMPKPTWEADNLPSQIITDQSEVEVVVPRLVRRFRVGIRRGAQGLTLKVTDGGTRRIRAACAKAGEGSWYEFDYATQEALIYVPGQTVPLSEWKRGDNG